MVARGHGGRGRWSRGQLPLVPRLTGAKAVAHTGAMQARRCGRILDRIAAGSLGWHSFFGLELCASLLGGEVATDQLPPLHEPEVPVRSYAGALAPGLRADVPEIDGAVLATREEHLAPARRSVGDT